MGRCIHNLNPGEIQDEEMGAAFNCFYSVLSIVNTKVLNCGLNCITHCEFDCPFSNSECYCITASALYCELNFEPIVIQS